ncbi:hypothetical protein B0H14DRAFT_2556741 [Mycena olivaceomarginata]|nr:hypothetical protein B0H14DRAFT_2556741 [Mycena olivaceomarginata]
MLQLLWLGLGPFAVLRPSLMGTGKQLTDLSFVQIKITPREPGVQLTQCARFRDTQRDIVHYNAFQTKNGSRNMIAGPNPPEAGRLESRRLVPAQGIVGWSVRRATYINCLYTTGTIGMVTRQKGES